MISFSHHHFISDGRLYICNISNIIHWIGKLKVLKVKAVPYSMRLELIPGSQPLTQQ